VYTIDATVWQGFWYYLVEILCDFDQSQFVYKKTYLNSETFTEVFVEFVMKSVKLSAESLPDSVLPLQLFDNAEIIKQHKTLVIYL